MRGRSLRGVLRMKKILALLARASVGFALLAAPELRAKAIEKMKTDGYMTDGL